MKRKVGNNLPFLAGAVVAALGAYFYLLSKKAGAIYLIAAAVLSAAGLLRFAKVARRGMLEYLNGSARFCKGKGIEIGSGGAHHVKGSLLVDMVDNFSSGKPYRVDYITDAHSLSKIEDASLDYVCASHVLEHLTNPIKAIREWSRILRPGGTLWLKIPDKRKTFDKTRKRTKLEHLIEDFRRNVPVDDQTHIEDNNMNTTPPRRQGHPYIHNHVWIPEDIVELFAYLKNEGAPLSVICCKENSSKNAQDFWITVKKEAE